jgi:hypothetical protein
VSAPAKVTVGAGSTATFAVAIDVLTTASDAEIWATLCLQGTLGEFCLPMWVHIDPMAKSGDVLLIDNDFSQFEDYTDYAPYVRAALDELGLSYVVWDADAQFGQPQTIPDLNYLQRFRTVMWITGDNVRPDGFYAVPTPLTSIDMLVLGSYLDAGGRLIAWGQNLTEASDINGDPDPTWGRAALYHDYLGAHWLQDSVFDPTGNTNLPPPLAIAAIGMPSSFLSGVTLDLGLIGDGAGNQRSIDEIAPGGVRDGSDVGLVQPLLMALGARPVGPGYIGLAKGGEPTLEQETPPVPYRSVYYSFGFEGVNDNIGRTTRADLLSRTIDWLSDEVSVAVEDALGAINDPMRLSCQASSSLSATISSYRWRVTEGERTQIVTSTQPFITVSYAGRGQYTVAVEAIDAFGHRAVGHGVVRIVDGGSSTLVCDTAVANPGQQLNYQVLAHNTSGSAMTISFALPLPQGADYVNHLGGTFEGGVLRWSGSLSAGASFGASLQVRARYDVPPGADIIATVQFRAGRDAFSKSVRTQVSPRVYVPFLVKPH